MQAKMNDVVHLKMEGRLAELLAKVDPKLYRKFLSVENGRSSMYVKLKRLLMEIYRQQCCSGRP